MDSELKPEPKQCKVCFKRTEKDCSHTSCPNRKLVTAQVPDATENPGASWKNKSMSEGTYRKFPTMGDE